MRIRHYSFFANCVRQIRLKLARQLLQKTGKLAKITRLIKPVDAEKKVCLCPACHQRNMRIIYQIPSRKQQRLRRQLLT